MVLLSALSFSLPPSCATQELGPLPTGLPFISLADMPKMTSLPGLSGTVGAGALSLNLLDLPLFASLKDQMTQAANAAAAGAVSRQQQLLALPQLAQLPQLPMGKSDTTNVPHSQQPQQEEEEDSDEDDEDEDDEDEEPEPSNQRKRGKRGELGTVCCVLPSWVVIGLVVTGTLTTRNVSVLLADGPAERGRGRPKRSAHQQGSKSSSGKGLGAPVGRGGRSSRAAAVSSSPSPPPSKKQQQQGLQGGPPKRDRADRKRTLNREAQRRFRDRQKVSAHARTCVHIGPNRHWLHAQRVQQCQAWSSRGVGPGVLQA